MPPRPNSSRIEVDLKLLEDKNIERLQEFGKQFDASIDRLANALQQEAQNLQGMAQQRAGQLSANASTGAVFTGPSHVSARPGGQLEADIADSRSGANYTVGQTPPPPGQLSSNASIAPGDSFERQYVRAQRRIGEIPVGLRQMLGYYAEGGPLMDAQGFELDEKTGQRIEDGNGGFKRGPWGRFMAGKLNSSLFQGEAIMANARRAYSGLQGIFASVAVPTQMGQALGASREGGWFGTGFMSPAFRRGFMTNFNAMKSADFGFNPNYSVAQAQAAAQATASMGYSGHMANVINEQMKQLQIHQQLDPGMVMSMLDPLLRYGGWQSGGQLIDVLRAIPEAAKAASFNLKTFTEQLQSTSLQIAQETGMQPGQVMGALSSFSAVTGLAPERAAGLFTADNLTLASAMTGKTMTQLVENPSAAPEMAYGLQVFRAMTGMSAQQLLELRKSNRGEYNRLMDGVYRMYERNKNIFGGFSPLELINMSVRNHGRTRQHMAADQQIQDMKLGAGSVNRIGGVMNFYGEGMGHEFADWRQKYLNDYFQHHSTMSAHDMAKFRQAAQDQALNMLAGHQQKQGRRAAVEITLSPQAKKWFDILTKDMGQQDTPGRNAGKAFWRAAMEVGGGALGATGLGPIGSEVGGFVGNEIGNLF